MSESKEQQHTSTRRPWEIYDFDGQVKDYPKTIIVAPTGESICEISGGWPQCTLAENEANAKLIVRAVNSHEALVEALRRSRDWMVEPMGGGLLHERFDDNKPCEADCLRCAVNAALALAEKES